LFNIVLSVALFTAMDIAGGGIPMLSTIIMHEHYFAFLLGNWVPAVNPLVSIWINRPYRDAVSKFIGSLFRKNTAASAVHPLNQ
jgi:hypothetical protein